MIQCSSCLRHHRAEDDACPFCARTSHLTKARNLMGGVVTSFVLAACYGGPGMVGPTPTNTDTATPADEDADGFGSDVDCNDADAAVNPDADEICDDGIDNDCDEAIDDLDEECVPPM